MLPKPKSKGNSLSNGSENRFDCGMVEKTSGVKHKESKANIRCKSKMIKAAKTQIYPVQPAIE